jgi:phage tail-like protein
MPGPYEFDDPFRGFSFQVEFGFIHAGFSEVSGLSEECSILEYAECTNPFSTTKVPDRFSFSNLTFKRGKTRNRDLVNWWLEVKGKRNVHAKRDGMIHLVDPQSLGIVSTWRVRHGWPVKLSLTDFVATSTNLVIESLEIAHEGIEDAVGIAVEAAEAAVRRDREARGIFPGGRF